MGAFSEAWEAFGAHGKHVYPTRPDVPAMPMVKNPQAFRTSTVPERFVNANAAFFAGPKNGLTVIDIDTPDRNVWDMARERFGETPFQVITPSGGVHWYFRNSREPRMIRPLDDPSGGKYPLDILGQGAVVAPPSSRAASEEKCAGNYTLFGDWETLGELPRVLKGAIPVGPGILSSHRETAVDSRNNTLFAKARALAGMGVADTNLLPALLICNDEFPEPLSRNEVGRVAGSVLQYKAQNRLIAPGGEPSIVWRRNETLLFAASPDGFLLETIVRQNNALRIARGELVIIAPKAMARDQVIPGWGIKRYRAAREWMLKNDRIELIHKGGHGKGDPDRFRFVGKGARGEPNVTRHPPLPLIPDGEIH